MKINNQNKNNFVWQTPGNSNSYLPYSNFDSFSESDLSSISINNNDKRKNQIKYLSALESLFYYYEKGVKSVSQSEAENKWKELYTSKYLQPENSSTPAHAFFPLIFFGFVYSQNSPGIQKTYSFTNLGREYYIMLKNKSPKDEIKNLILEQIFSSKYPNAGAKATKSIFVYPFKLVFNLLSNNKKISKKNFIYFPYISNYESYEAILKGNFDFFDSKISNFGKGRAEKFVSWIYPSLLEYGFIYEDQNGFILLSDIVINKLDSENLLSKISIFDFSNYCQFLGDSFLPVKTSNRVRKSFSNQLIYAFHGRKCSCCGVTETFKQKTDGGQYFEGHHFIPFSSFSQYEVINWDIDTVENIVPLCPTCHRKIHLGIDSDKIIALKNIFNNHPRKDYYTSNPSSFAIEDLFPYYRINNVELSNIEYDD